MEYKYESVGKAVEWCIGLVKFLPKYYNARKTQAEKDPKYPHRATIIARNETFACISNISNKDWKIYATKLGKMIERNIEENYDIKTSQLHSTDEIEGVFEKWLKAANLPMELRHYVIRGYVTPTRFEGYSYYPNNYEDQFFNRIKLPPIKDFINSTQDKTVSRFLYDVKYERGNLAKYFKNMNTKLKKNDLQLLEEIICERFCENADDILMVLHDFIDATFEKVPQEIQNAIYKGFDKYIEKIREPQTMKGNLSYVNERIAEFNENFPKHAKKMVNTKGVIIE